MSPSEDLETAHRHRHYTAVLKNALALSSHDTIFEHWQTFVFRPVYGVESLPQPGNI